MSENNVYRVHLADPGGRISVQDVPTDAFEATERGIMLNGRTIVPWHRVIRYIRDVVQPLDEPELMTHAEIRAWLDDGTESGETLRSERIGSTRDRGRRTSSWSTP